MATLSLVADRDQAIANILRYQTELADRPRGAGLRNLMSMVHAWYAAKPDGERWFFAPSKFVGYSNNTAEAYFSERNERDGRQTERVLQQWFHTVEPGTHRADALESELRAFLSRYGHSAPRKGARICIPTEILGRRADAPQTPARVAIDPAICAGRPHIRGTRVRVSDILELLASGAAAAEILDDYPYLEEADLNAALAYGATATDHRIVIAA
ncbi:MAG: DUF433 domain-containing protein [Rhodospirillaceae bacterium]|nr:DUF433 domain-containing protein [Rhodospirillaceae bacterium]MDE0618699.1 DUF433 domain-containing protein [Rhodospirillaceae bacterium]